MSDVTKVNVGKPKIGGAIFYAPLGSTLPTDATSALDEAFAGFGYVSEDGVTESNETETNETKAWGGDIVDSSLSSKKITEGFKLIESTNEDVLKFVYGEENVTTSGGITVKVNTKDIPSVCLVIDMVLKGGKKNRLVMPIAKLSELGDIVYSDSEVIAYDCKVTGMADAEGNMLYKYIEK